MNTSDFAQDAPFLAPWHAQVFGLTVALHERGMFDWPTWAQALGAQLKAEGEYWEAWLAALEGLLAARGVAVPADINALAEQWQDAAHATPHGQPILLENATKPAS
ncbi:nitrile hydratase accessory protein [Pararhodobacter sp.]|uniref:nitrile hydratase accessory protein n=1 Tax=Pararhodobacter sp. TaxID=2127056 RepID=UPI002AFF2F59|nr:nitrile hydratase accessory protein [Pararhodobacter sp.]